MENIELEKYTDLIMTYAVPIFWAIVILIVGRIIAKVISNNIAKILKKSSMDITIVKFIKNLSLMTMTLFVILVALEEVGVKTTSFTAVIAAAGLAIGFAFQASLSNFASGFMLLFFKPFKAGDYVEAGGVSGNVQEIQLFTTIFKTPDNKVVIVPNGQITGGSITNFSAQETRRVDLLIGVSYDDDLKKVKEVLADILKNEDRILDEPAPVIGLLALADSSINFAVRPWVKTENYWPVLFDIQEEIKERFDKEGISIPFPQRDVHMINNNSK